MRVFSSLNHENIVNYHCSWVEFDIVHSKKKRNSSINNKTLVHTEFPDSQSSGDTSGSNYIIYPSDHESVASSDVVFEHSKKNEISEASSVKKAESSVLITDNSLSSIPNGKFFSDRIDNSGEYSEFTSNGSDVISAKDKLAGTLSNGTMFPESETTCETVMVLYIQMKLCDFTLKHWLDIRNDEIFNNNCKIDEHASMNICRQILCGVEYLHSKFIIHR